MSALPAGSAAISTPPLRVLDDPAARPSAGRRMRAGMLAMLGLIGLPVGAHVAFSRFGFNPTDDGFVLAYGRRLLEGQVPHRDFISIRPVGSAILHLPELLLAGDHVFIAGRLVTWLEIGFIAWAWVVLARRWTGAPRGMLAGLLMLLAAFACTAGTFPIMPWHTIDALALTSAGLLLASATSAPAQLAGFACLGAAVLCRQNFLPVGWVALALLPPSRRTAAAIAWVAPLVVTAIALAGLGALADAAIQLRAQTGLLETGVLRFVRTPHFGWGLALGAAWAFAGRIAPRRTVSDVLDACVVPLLLVWAASTMSQRLAPYLWQASFAMFGASLGRVLGALGAKASPGELRLGLLALVVAWCSSVSVGMNTPALAGGALAVHLLAARGRPNAERPEGPRFAGIVAIAGVIAIAGLWVHARMTRIYRDRPAAELRARLDGVLAGGRGIVTNPQTAELLADLDRAIASAGGRPVAIIADFPAHWVRSTSRNPLSIDWPQGTELSRPALRARVLGDLERLRGRGVILVQKHHTALVARAFLPTQADGDYFLVTHVREHFRRTGGTAHFDLYQ